MFDTRSNRLGSGAQRSGKKTNKKRTKGAELANWWPLVLLVVVIASTGAIRIHLADFPLERDEGEYAYAGQLLLQSIDPYAYCYSMKLPGTASAYALLMAVFGQTAVGVHLGLLLVNSASILLLYLLAAHLYGRLAAIVASATFALLSLEPAVMGFAGHATQFVILPAVGGALLLVLAIERERNWLFLASGLSLGMSFLMKQPGFFFVGFGAFYLVFVEWARRARWLVSGVRLGLLLLGSALPFGLVCLFYWWTGNFHRFWFWVYYYAQKYAALVRFSRGWENFKEAASSVISPAMMFWIIAVLGLVAVFWRPRIKSHTVFVVGFLVFSFAAVCTGLYFRTHYFVLLLPVTSLLAGIAISRATEVLRKSEIRFIAVVPGLIFAVAFLMSAAQDSDFFFAKDIVSACHQVYGVNPFPEAPRIAEFIRSRARENDEIAVLGSEPEIYFYSHLRSATGFVYMYPLMEHVPFAKVMQQELEREVDSARPRFVVFVAAPSSWLRNVDSESGIFDWSHKFLADHYRMIGLVDLMEDNTEFHFDDDARNYTARSSSRVLIYERT